MWPRHIFFQFIFLLATFAGGRRRRCRLRWRSADRWERVWFTWTSSTRGSPLVGLSVGRSVGRSGVRSLARATVQRTVECVAPRTSAGREGLKTPSKLNQRIEWEKTLRGTSERKREREGAMRRIEKPPTIFKGRLAMVLGSRDPIIGFRL